MNKSILLAVAFLGASVVCAEVSEENPFGIPLDGRVLHLDASSSEIGKTLFLDDEGGVTNWTSKAGPISDVKMEFTLHQEKLSGIKPPLWTTDGMNGRPAVYFGTDLTTGEYRWTGLMAPSVDIYHRSVFFVFACSNAAPGYANFYTEYSLGSPTIRINQTSNTDPVYNSLTGRVRWMVTANFMPRVDYGGVTDVYYPADESTAFHNSGVADFRANEPQLMFCVMRSTTDHSQPFKFRYNLPLCIGQTYRSDHEKWGWRGPFCEVLAYDRDLTEREIEQITACLRAKWFAPGKTSIWVGGASGDWETASNWSNGVPGLSEEDVAVINTAAEITMNQPIALHDFIANAAGTLKVKGGKLSIGGSFVAPSDYQVEIVGDLDLHLKSRSLMQLPQVSATGKLSVTGGGKLKFYGLFDGKPSVCVRSGKVDLNGTTQVFASFEAGIVTNTSATASSLKVSVPEMKTGKLSGIFADGISLFTEGAVEIERSLCGHPSLRIGAGEVTTTTKLSPVSVPGLTMRLDASDASSIVTNADGRVTEWSSFLPENAGLQFGNTHLGELFHRNSTGLDYPVTYPTFVKNVQNGLPGVWFGRNADGEIEIASLIANDQGVSHMTAFAVLVPGEGIFGQDRILGRYNSSQGLMFLDHNKSTGFIYYSDCSEGTYANLIVNGKYDRKDKAWLAGDRSKAKHPNAPHISVSSKSTLNKWFSPTLVYNTQSKGNKDITPYDGYICELLLYDRELTQSETEGIEQYLMEKWGITPEAELQGCVDVPTKLAFDITGGLGSLLLQGDLDVTETALEFIGGNPAPGKFLMTSGTLTGPFKSVTGTTRDVKYTANSARFPSGLILFLK